MQAIGQGQDFVLDNASNTLTVARADAAVAKRMFLFLGLPGLLLAAFLASYSGAVLAAAQRREQANLRVRGANPGQLTRILLYRTGALAGLASLLGAGAGLASSTIVLGPSALFAAAPGALALSAAIAVAAGVAITGLALYLPGRRALRREVSGERQALAAASRPAWRRYGLDYAGALAAAVAVVLLLRSGGFGGPTGSVSTGQATSLPARLLLVPLGAWCTGILLSTRLLEGVATHLPMPRRGGFGPTVRGILTRSLSRRVRPLITATIGVGLVVAFGMGLGMFTATYDAAKLADARFTVGSDLRVTPSPVSPAPHPAAFARRLQVAGVAQATPVVASLENAFLRSAFNSDVQNLAAIDPKGYARTAPLADGFFVDATVGQALAALAAAPANVLLDADIADGLKLGVGDTADLLLARATRHQKLRRVKVAGLFTRFPGFPEGVQVVANLAFYAAQTQTDTPDFFLAGTTGHDPAALAAATSALRHGPGRGGRLSIDSTQTSLNKDQSSLTALNVNGLLALDSAYTVAITAAIIAIFVFGLMLQRRREYIVLIAQGLAAGGLRTLLLGEAAFVALGGLLAGLGVGTGLGLLLVKVLSPLFLLAPQTTVAAGDVARLAAIVAVATLGSVASALGVLRALRPAEILRET